MNQLQIVKTMRKLLCQVSLVLIFTIGYSAWGQENPKVTQEVDTTRIKIGEQINYKVKVEADSTAQVIFPEGQTFSPFEVVEAFDVDTIKGKEKFSWIRKYAISQFDSGAYYIPQQRIVVNNKPYMLDSIAVSVAGVQVDTIKQPLYDIKPIEEVKEVGSFDATLLYWLLIPLLAIGFIVYWFVIRKKPLTEEEKIALLPPFDRAIQELKELENSKYIIESNYKGYYSELTTIVKRYLEGEVRISALESTTDELFDSIKELQEKGSVNLEQETINNFKSVLQTADLVKFARSKPEDQQVNSDRKVIEGVVVETKESLPEPTEEELAETEAYKEELLKRRKKKRVMIAVASSILVVFLTIGGIIWYYGFTYVKDTVLGHETKELLERKWVTSEYGIPPIRIETPKVLERKEVEIPEGQDSIFTSMKSFEYGSVNSRFYIFVNTKMFKSQSSPDLQIFAKHALQSLQNKGLKNMITKNEDFVSKDGVSGIKVFGSTDLPYVDDEAEEVTTEAASTDNDKATKTREESEEEVSTVKGAYELILFASPNYVQMIMIVHEADDQYSKKLVQRIESSIEVNTMAKINSSKEK
ncbi:hypothetical protein NBRC110019_17660 [Neptunitalea chrysea]|uniref:Oxygen tolerance n=1 Tax=Neptunitalea chrysea TaxID=1647581 RepID=A0A9W6B4R6_9FLAO|nr:hypothetical protein [Neptunitalea chrysea]GLB52726.1 hypothetical protein NBRC110019_17660 [Neptunitalea chrysea]